MISFMILIGLFAWWSTDIGTHDPSSMFYKPPKPTQMDLDAIRAKNLREANEAYYRA